MAATAPLEKDRIHAARKALQARRGQLYLERKSDTQELAIPPEDRGEDTTTSQHPADVASDLEVHEFALTRGLIDTRDLREVEDALARIDEGTYGLCIDCGGEIPWERLEVRPQAARDVECEGRWERQGRHR